MAKKRFLTPSIMLAIGSGGSGSIVGPGSGQGTPDDDIQFDWEMWAVMYDEYDGNNNGIGGEWADYVLWWQSHPGWTEDQFKFANNGLGYDDEQP